VAGVCLQTPVVWLWLHQRGIDRSSQYRGFQKHRPFVVRCRASLRASSPRRVCLCGFRKAALPLDGPPQFVRSVAEIFPFDFRDPTLLNIVILNDAFDQHFVWLAVIVRIIRVENQHEPVSQFDPLTLQILKRAEACQSKTIGVIQILKVGIDSRGIHKLTSIDATVRSDSSTSAGTGRLPSPASVHSTSRDMGCLASEKPYDIPCGFPHPSDRCNTDLIVRDTRITCRRIGRC
jgi:hypothetical protein